ncbi:MAG: isocitrate/isopropylmalate dehydrogenase family protein [Hyphomicrobiales bacterium]
MKLLFLPGDGIGPEICRATFGVAKALEKRFSLGLDFVHETIGFDALKRHNTTMPTQVLERARAADGIVLGPVSHADYPSREEGGLNPSGVLRRELQLFANVRPARTRDQLPHPAREPFDLVVVRENLEGFYADRTMFAGTGEFMPTPDLALSVRKVTAQGSRRIAERAFQIAAERKRKVTAVHKANVLRVSGGLFLEHVRDVANQWPDIEYDEMLIDAAAAHLIRNPAQFDTIVTTNMFGDILSDEASELSGGLGLAASLNEGNDHAVAQAQHGSAPGIADQDIANPTSLIGSLGMLLHWLSVKKNLPLLHDAAFTLETALSHALSAPETRTRDIGGVLGTNDFGKHLAHAIERKLV